MEIKLEALGAHYAIEHVTTNLMKERLNVRTSFHKHPVFHIIYIVEGKGQFTIGSNTTTARPGMLYIISPNEPHAFLFGDGEPLTDFECTFRLLDSRGEAAIVDFFDMVGPVRREQTLETAVTRPLLVPSRSKPLLVEGFERILDLYASPLMGNRFDLMVADLLARVESVVFDTFMAEHPRDPAEATVENVKHFLNTNRHRPVTLRETAAFAHLSPNYLCRLFKRYTGETPMGYLQTVRMREAEKLLSLTDLPIATIAAKLGYIEPSYFTRVFRAVCGESPQAYRKRVLIENRII